MSRQACGHVWAWRGMWDTGTVHLLWYLGCVEVVGSDGLESQILQAASTLSRWPALKPGRYRW